MNIEGAIKQVTNNIIAMPEGTDLWLSWYYGDVENFHKYETYNGKKNVTCKRKTLNMPKKISEDWANLLLNERTDVAYGNDKQQQALWDLLNSVKFWQKGNEGIEKTFALGNGAFVESYDNNGNVRFQFVNAKKIYPVSIEQDAVTECAFVNTNGLKTVVQYHLKDENGFYFVRTQVFKKQDMKNTDIGVLEEDAIVETKSKQPWFQMIKPNIANNLDINSPLGISVYANSLDIIAGIDLAYDGFCEEMRLGKLKTFVNSDLFDYQENRPVFDADDVGFYIMSNSADPAKDPIKFYNPTLRTQDYFNGVNNGLNLLSAKVGFGENHYRFDVGGISTATQVISENSEMFRTIKKHEILLNDILVDCIRALMYINNEFTSSTVKFDLNQDIEIKFDDSIIEDKATEKLNDRTDVNLGVMSKVQYRMKWFNEDEETARANIEAIAEENRNTMTNFFSEE